MNLNFEMKDKYQTNIQKFHILILYIITYLLILILMLNILYWIGSYIIISSEKNVTQQTKDFYSSHAVLAVIFLIFSFLNLIYADYYKREDPYKLNFKVFSFLIFNLLILAPLSLIDLPAFLINFVVAMVITNTIIMILMIPVGSITKKYLIDGNNNEPAKQIPEYGFIICNNCKMQVKFDLDSCPNCGNSIIT